MIPRRWKRPLKFADTIARALRVPPPDDVTRFIVLTSPRSGSTWIVDLLDSHPDITCFSEVFVHGYYGRPTDGGNPNIRTWDSFATTRLPELGRTGRLKLYFEYLDRHVFSAAHGSRAVGFKLMYEQAMRGFGIPAYLKARNVSIVHLIRHNHLDLILSEEGRLARKMFHAPVGAEIPKIQIELEAHTLLFRIRERAGVVEQARADWSRFGLPCLELSYEEMLKDPSLIRQVLEFLNLPGDGIELSSPLQKLNPTSHRDLLSNFEEIEQTLRGTEFDWMLH